MVVLATLLLQEYYLVVLLALQLGNTASNPNKGLVYVLSQDYPSFYKLERRPPPIPAAYRARYEASQARQRGQIAFSEHCATCHGKDLAGTGLGPSLLSLAGRLSPTFLRETVLYGTGRMPAIQHIEDEDISNILAYLKNKSTAFSESKIEITSVDGPVVASGGAPSEKEMQSMGVSNRGGNEYPEDVDAPTQRYYTSYGLGRPYIMKPPWSSITAYDMNTGKIQWTKPLGQDPYALEKGFKNTGVPTGSQRNGMVITSNGIIFTTVTTGEIYAYDAENGNILWQSQTELGIASMPSMYEINNRVYLVVNATTPQITGWNQTEEEKQNAFKDLNEGVYQVYALPEIKK